MQRIQRLIRLLQANQYIDVRDITDWNVKRAIYQEPGTYTDVDTEQQTINVGDWLVDSGTTAFLNKVIELPEHWSKEDIAIIFQAGGNGKQSYCESLMTINGIPTQGLDRNRNLVKINPDQLKDNVLQVEIELFNPVGIPTDHLRGFNLVASPETDPPRAFLEQSQLVWINKPVQSFLYTLEICYKTWMLLEKSDTRSHVLHQAMEQIVEHVGIPQEKTLQDASLWITFEEQLKAKLDKVSGYREGTIRAIGQSHIDTAWLWPIKETVRKTSRTFSSVCTLLEEYDDFEFAQSQPQLFAYLKEYYPKVYDRVKQKVKEGRFEIIGGMWVEPDLNIPSGESLVRQLLYGKQFFKEEFGAEPRVEWLPDTFGYCASLPQILKKAGTDYFMTTKLNWNDTNRFPYDLFYWEGIDGTKILSYLHTILGQQTEPKDIKNTWDDFIQKNEYNERMLVYGYGDGGGGVTREMIENLDRSSQLPGLPDVKFDKVHSFFDRVKEENPNLPKWYGDLYLELHRGTYTTHAKTKKNNRQAEALYRDLEIWHSFAFMALGKQYPVNEIKEGWKLILLNQFHDIVPGTSIEPVYKLSSEQYQQVFEIGTKLHQDAVETISQEIDTEGPGQPLVLFNSLSWNRDELVTVTGGQELIAKKMVDHEGNTYQVEHVVCKDGSIELRALVTDIPQMGYKTVWLVEDDGNTSAKSTDFNMKWETPIYKVEFTEQGSISRLYDKQADKEIVKEGEYLNELQLFDDLPTDWDAWDIDPHFEKQRNEHPELISTMVVHQGKVTDKLEFIWNLNQSVVTQEITFYHHSKQIDFKTNVDWKETHKLLKVAFPVNVYSSRATYEIPFGSVERPTHNNTSWEQAQYEVCGQRWADLSEGNYGVSLLNDSKYGYDIKGNNIRLSLLRAPKWPDTSADIEEHAFTYTLYPHIGDWRMGETARKGHELNSAVTVIQAEAHDGTLPASKSFVETASQSAIVDAIKQSEDQSGIVARVYEAEGSETNTELSFGFNITSIKETNLLEEPIENEAVQVDKISKKVKPYEICSFYIK